MDTEVKELLLKAADLIEERGWAQNAFQNDQGNLCIVGALNSVLYGNAYAVSPIIGSDLVNKNQKLLVKAQELLIKILNKDNQIKNLYSWNDLLSTSKEEVISILKKASEE